MPKNQDPNDFSDTIKAADDLEEVIPKNSEYYTLDLSRDTDQDTQLDSEDITASTNRDIARGEVETTGSSSYYEGNQVAGLDADEDNVVGTDKGGVVSAKDALEEDDTSAKVGAAGHQGVDAETD